MITYRVIHSFKRSLTVDIITNITCFVKLARNFGTFFGTFMTQQSKLWQQQKICDNTQKLKLWPNSKLQIMRNLKDSNCDKTQKYNCDQTNFFLFWQNSKTQISDKILKPKFWKKKKNIYIIMTKLINLNTENTQKLISWQNSNYDQTQKLKFWQNFTTQILTKLKNSNSDKTKKSN